MSAISQSSEAISQSETNKSFSGKVVVTRRVHFNAAHRLVNTDFPAAWNEEQYGSCNNALWHGHNYTLEVSLKGEPDPRTGYVIDLRRLKSVIKEEIIEKCDHRNLNLEVDFLQGIIPSAENLVIAFWRQLEKRLGKGKLHCLRLYETERNYAEYYGE
ncbi:MAG: 6-carboxytetrahydropterin synthase [Opitutales bacterium]|nr:6-carboxytetrahydropterin synthase [Opitutales bacterium]MCH8540957.1 6-carboxytetrahydropterin synthase [Opitutales bacterium]